MAQFVEGELYVTTEGVDMRPHGFVPGGTVVRVVELFKTGHVAFEFAYAQPDDLVGYVGDWIPATDMLRTLKPFTRSILSRVQSRAKTCVGAAVILGLILAPVEDLVTSSIAYALNKEPPHVVQDQCVLRK
jgi:hypothetical protein